MPLQRDVDECLGTWWGISPGSGSIQRAFRRVEEHGLVEIICPSHEKLGWRSRPSNLIRLSERGGDVYRLLAGRDPAASYTMELLRRHKSAEHAVLNMETAEILWRAGYEVELFPEPVDVRRGTYYPDLRAEVEGHPHLIYVECERVVGVKELQPQAMVRKWELYYAASGGRFHVSTPTREEMEASAAHILSWAGGRPLVLRMMDVAQCREHPSREIWVTYTG